MSENSYINYLPKCVQNALSRSTTQGTPPSLSYEHFYLLLKSALTFQLQRLRPFYVAVDNASSSNTEQRLQCNSPQSNSISLVKLHICSTLSLIYDYYQTHILEVYWNLCKEIAHGIIADDQVRVNQTGLMKSRTSRSLSKSKMGDRFKSSILRESQLNLSMGITSRDQLALLNNTTDNLISSIEESATKRI